MLKNAYVTCKKTKQKNNWPNNEKWTLKIACSNWNDQVKSQSKNMPLTFPVFV